MEIKLKLFLIIICIIFMIFIYKKLSKGTLQIKYSFPWYGICIFLIISTLFDFLLDPIKNFLGFETTSNMIFVISIFTLSLITFTNTIRISELNKKVTRLTQEVALLKKEQNQNEKNK